MHWNESSWSEHKHKWNWGDNKNYKQGRETQVTANKKKPADMMGEMTGLSESQTVVNKGNWGADCERIVNAHCFYLRPWRTAVFVLPAVDH